MVIEKQPRRYLGVERRFGTVEMIDPVAANRGQEHVRDWPWVRLGSV